MSVTAGPYTELNRKNDWNLLIASYLGLDHMVMHLVHLIHLLKIDYLKWMQSSKKSIQN